MTSDHGAGAEGFGVHALAGLADGVIHATTTWRIDRYDAEQTAWAHDRFGIPTSRGLTVEEFASLGIAPYETTEQVGNAILQAGWARAGARRRAGGSQG